MLLLRHNKLLIKGPMVLWIYFIMETVLSICSGCPPTYEQISPDLCVINLGPASSFCEASAMCANYGAERGELAFLVGRNVRRLIPSLNPATNLWLGMNGFLILPNRTAVAWRDTDPRTPRFTTVGEEIVWFADEPGGAESVIVFQYSSKAMHDCYPTCLWPGERFFAYCEYGGSLPTMDRPQEYRSDFPVPIDNFIQTDMQFFGCYREVDEPSIIACTLKCTLNVACRSIYYHKESHRCVSMMYADSLLPSVFTSSPNGWKRLAKTSYAGTVGSL
ncbi:hypothetical protein X801_09625 [Opisthorchis viverrini]|uniref:PAN domain protein n=1 Tax=Opisthorchis viverrini TaxID=6198 RepID=A0A1S8WJH2_OPIVI|nr:hypothetical protein X801_09625 [Opisthorchis viverrini]